MVRQQTFPLKQFVLHQTDRDPENGFYSGDRLLTREFGDLMIVSINVQLKTVTARNLAKKQPRIVFELQEEKSDLNLFRDTICRRWFDLHQDYKDNEDYHDFLPAYYECLADIHEKRGLVVVFDNHPWYNEFKKEEEKKSQD